MSNQRQASSASQVPHLSPAELSYLYTSLSLPKNPIRPDGRSPTQFRPLSAETTILPGTNGSARIGFADGTQAIVGVKAEVEKTVLAADTLDSRSLAQHGDALNREGEEGSAAVSGQGEWVQMSIEIPGFRDDDALPVFLSEMMRESLVGSVAGGNGDAAKEMAGGLKGRLVINKRWHWRLYIDVSFEDRFLFLGLWFLFLRGFKERCEMITANMLFSRSCSSPNLSHTPSPSSRSQPTSPSSALSYQNSSPRVKKTPSSTMTGLLRSICTPAPILPNLLSLPLHHTPSAHL